MDSQIKRFVYRVRNRVREQFVIDNLIKFAGGGMLIAVILSLIALVVPFYYVIVVATMVLVASFFAGIIWGVRKTPTPMEAALYADAKGHKEKISTAFYLVGKEDVFAVLQKRDAVRILENFSIRKEFPIRIAWKQFGMFALLSILFVVCSLVDTPAKQLAEMRHEVSKEAKEEIAELEKLEKELDKAEELSESEIADVKEQLDNAKKELREAESYEDLKKAEERITKKMEMASKNVQDKTLSEMLAQAAEESEERQQNKEEELLEEAKEALEKAEKGTDEEKAEAYEKLKKLAAATGNSQLAQAAEDYKNSSYSNDSYAQASQALSEASKSSSNSDYASNSQNNSNSNNASQSNQSQSGNNNSQGQNGQGQSGQQGNNGGQNGQDGNGNGNGSGSGGNGSGGGAGWNYGGKDGKEGSNKTAENVTIPEGELGDDENLTGQANGNDSSTKEKSNESRTWSGDKVSYDDVSGEYKNKAYKKVDGSSYPGKIKEKIRNYFNGLN
ncbi:MAG: hypothetical protein IJP29_03715 [Lachnospiraceae bacterium]|nr:hypothetical protein [Lachnospiraceae bacterium]